MGEFKLGDVVCFRENRHSDNYLEEFHEAVDTKRRFIIIDVDESLCDYEDMVCTEYEVQPEDGGRIVGDTSLTDMRDYDLVLAGPKAIASKEDMEALYG